MKALILGGGTPLSKDQLIFLLGEGYSCVVAADAGAETARALHLSPSAVIGDFDSIQPNTLAHCRRQKDCEVIHLPRQTDSDVEKCLEFLEGKGCTSCVLCGVTGDRLDHGLASLALLLRWSLKMHLALFAGKSVIEVVRGGISFKTTPRTTISLFGFSAETYIRSEGLEYPLRDEALNFGEREGLSNAALGDSVRLMVRGGGVYVVRDFQEVTRYGFIVCAGEGSGS